MAALSCCVTLDDDCVVVVGVELHFGSHRYGSYFS